MRRQVLARRAVVPALLLLGSASVIGGIVSFARPAGTPEGAQGFAQQSTAGDETTPPGRPIPSAGPGTSLASGTDTPRLLPGDVRIIIPAIGVDAPVVDLGLNPDGTLQVPTSFTQAGWWSGGPFPGDPGAAVVVGHISSIGGPAVFYRLADLRPGDRVVVTLPTGGSTTFRVTRSLQVAKTDFPTQLVYGAVPGRELRLVTCGGAFDSATGHFYDSVIVFATAVSQSR